MILNRNSIFSIKKKEERRISYKSGSNGISEIYILKYPLLMFHCLKNSRKISLNGNGIA